MHSFFKKAAAALSVIVVLTALPMKAGALQYTGTASYMSGKYYQQLRQVCLSGDPRTDLVAIARSQLGYQEGGSPNQLSGQVYGGVNAPYIWFRTPDGMDSWKFFDRLLYEACVVTTPGAGFGPSGEGYIRVTAFGDAEATYEAVERILSVM